MSCITPLCPVATCRVQSGDAPEVPLWEMKLERPLPAQPDAGRLAGPIRRAPTPTPCPLKGACRQDMGRARSCGKLRNTMRRWVLGVVLAAHAFAQTHPDA
jgi:hypothetical protein